MDTYSVNNESFKTLITLIEAILRKHVIGEETTYSVDVYHKEVHVSTFNINVSSSRVVSIERMNLSIIFPSIKAYETSLIKNKDNKKELDFETFKERRKLFVDGGYKTDADKYIFETFELNGYNLSSTDIFDQCEEYYALLDEYDSISIDEEYTLSPHQRYSDEQLKSLLNN